MILEGTITRCLPIKEGISKEGRPWMKAMYVLETDDRYPRRIVFSVMGEEKIKEFSFVPEQKVRLGVDIESREWQGHWFTEIRCVALLDPEAEGVVEATPQPVAQQTAEQPAMQAEPIEENSIELPF